MQHLAPEAVVTMANTNRAFRSALVPQLKELHDSVFDGVQSPAPAVPGTKLAYENELTRRVTQAYNCGKIPRITTLDDILWPEDDPEEEPVYKPFLDELQEKVCGRNSSKSEFLHVMRERFLDAYEGALSAPYQSYNAKSKNYADKPFGLRASVRLPSTQSATRERMDIDTEWWDFGNGEEADEIITVGLGNDFVCGAMIPQEHFDCFYSAWKAAGKPKPIPPKKRWSMESKFAKVARTAIGGNESLSHRHAWAEWIVGCEPLFPQRWSLMMLKPNGIRTGDNFRAACKFWGKPLP